MDRMQVIGGTRLEGDIYVSGAKNSVLVGVAAALLTSEVVTFENVPDLQDLKSMQQLLKSLGASFEFAGNSSYKGSMERKAIIDAGTVHTYEAPYDIVRKMRTSILILGPLLARFGEAKVSLPGGCAIGNRPINLHLDALRTLGANIQLENGYITASAPHGLTGSEIVFDIVTVGATENAMMAATLARGTTTIRNAAREPEIVDLADLLIGMGANITGAGTDTITVTGVQKLHGTTHRVIPDRIEAGTFAVAAAITGGRLKVHHAAPDHLSALFAYLEKAGAKITKGSDWFEVTGSPTILPVNFHTAPYPSFPTDLQGQVMALLCIAQGTSQIVETIFENRFMHVPELNRLGADIALNDNTATIIGVPALRGAQVMATDLRASVSLVLAGLVAEGKTIINRIYHLDRGYEHLEEKLSHVGAKISRLTDTDVSEAA